MIGSPVANKLDDEGEERARRERHFIKNNHIGNLREGQERGILSKMIRLAI